MAQVQLYIAKSQHGYTGVANINPSEDVVRYIRDFGPALGVIDYDASREEVFYLIKYVEEGLLLTLLRPIEGAPKSHLAATLYFPLGLRIDKEQFLALVDEVRAVVAKGTDPGTEDVAMLRQLLSTDYGIDESRPHFRESQGKTTAFVYIGAPAPTLGDFFDVRFYQPEYPDFDGVLLVDRLSGAKGKEGSRELSGELRAIYTVLPPRTTHEGFAPNVFHEPFRRPVIAAKDSVLDIVWRRSGFESITSQVKVDRDGMRAPQCDTSGARKLIAPSSFYITDQSSRKLVKEPSIKVNGVEITDPTPFKFNELTHARVDITSPGYVNFSSNLDLAGSRQALVQMRKLHKSYRFDMPLLTPEPLEPLRIYIKTLKPLTECPIEGYQVAGGELVEGGGANSLFYVGKPGRNRTLKQILALVGALLVGFLIGWLVFGGSKEQEEEAPVPAPVPVEAVQEPAPEVQEIPESTETAENTENTENSQQSQITQDSLPSQPSEPQVIDVKAAVEYLDNNKMWAREEMDAIPGLAGLYDDLNNYNFSRIKTYWAPLLKDSSRFKAVNDAVVGSASKRDPRTGAHDPQYSKDGGAINWRQYTYWVDP